jgi:hypothetical protein
VQLGDDGGVRRRRRAQTRPVSTNRQRERIASGTEEWGRKPAIYSHLRVSAARVAECEWCAVLDNGQSALAWISEKIDISGGGLRACR